MLSVNWEEIERDNPSNTAVALNDLLQQLYDECIPVRMIRRKSSDAPWMTRKIRRLIRARKRCYKKHGRSARWRQRRDEAEAAIKEAKVKYAEKIKDKIKAAGNNKSFFQMSNMFSANDLPMPRWKIQSMFPGQTNSAVAEKAAEFFLSLIHI